MPKLANDAESDGTSKLVTNANSIDIIPLKTQTKTPFNTPPMLWKITFKQVFDDYCNVASRNLCHVGSEFHIDYRALLVRKSVAYKSIQIKTRTSLGTSILYLVYHLPIVRHPRQRQMYDTLRRTTYWPHMASDVSITIVKCKSCARNRSCYHQKRPLQLFPASGPFHCTAIDILGLLPRTSQSTQCLSFMTD